MKKKIVLNVSTIRVGGAVQVAINLLKSSFLEDRFDIFYVTNTVLNELIDLPMEKTFVCDSFPSNPFNLSIKKDVRNFVENVVNADIVYSVGAPSYINFKCREVLRLTNPWLIEKDILAFKKLSFLDRSKLKLEILVKKTYLRKAQYFITQTEDAKNKIVTNLKKEDSNVYVVSNVYSYNLSKYISEDFIRDYNGDIRILCISALHFHKNLDICIAIAKRFKESCINRVKFVLTLPFEEWEKCNMYQSIKEENLEDFFENIGRVKLIDLPEVYIKSHVLFMPTLLEVFSASFLEAMIFKIPIVTTNLGFNTGVCEDAAVYYNNVLSSEEAFISLYNVLKDDKLRTNIVSKGLKIVSEMDDNSNVYKKHFDIISNVLLK